MLVPSLWRESLGRVPMEAMANGIPVLASDRGALPETLGNAVSCSRSPNDTRPNPWRSRRPAKSPPGWTCWKSSGTIRSSRPGTAS